MHLSARSAAVCVLALVGLVAGCGGISKGDFTSALVKQANLSEPVARCVTDRVFEQLDDAQIEKVFKANNVNELSADERQVVMGAAVACVSGGASTTNTTTGATTTGK